MSSLGSSSGMDGNTRVFDPASRSLPDEPPDGVGLRLPGRVCVDVDSACLCAVPTSREACRLDLCRVGDGPIFQPAIEIGHD